MTHRTDRDEFTDSLLDDNNSIQYEDDDHHARKTAIKGQTSKSRPTTLRNGSDASMNLPLRKTFQNTRKKTMTNEQKSLFLKNLASGELN